MTLLNPFRRYTSSLFAYLELGRMRRVRQERRLRIAHPVESLEKRALLSAVAGSPPVVQFDVSSVLNADVVVNKPANSPVDTTQSPVDRNNGNGNGNWAFLTQSAANALHPPGATPDGLPDNGFFAANSFHPDVQLAVNNESNGINARRADIDGLVLPVSQFGFTLAVPANTYQEIHVFMTAGMGAATFTLKLNYADGTSTTSAVTTVPDWLQPVNSSQSVYNLITLLDREKADASSYQNSNQATLFGFRFAADPGRQLQS